MRGLAHQIGVDSWCAGSLRVYDEGVVRANTSHEDVPWPSEFADCGAPVAPLKVATIEYVHTAFKDEPLYEIGISFTAFICNTGHVDDEIDVASPDVKSTSSTTENWLRKLYLQHEQHPHER